MNTRYELPIGYVTTLEVALCDAMENVIPLARPSKRPRNNYRWLSIARPFSIGCQNKNGFEVLVPVFAPNGDLIRYESTK